MFKVKICGITCIEDAMAVVQAGADALGLNFYARSPRYITVDVARAIVKTLPANVGKVGLFGDTSADEVCRQFDDLGLDLIQLHGDQSPDFVAQLGGRPVMRAFRASLDGLGPIVQYVEQCRALAAPLTMVLIDALVAGQFGGTGQTADWSVARQYAAAAGLPPLVLAGGLNPSNVAEAIRAVRPSAVDAASGVESSPGRKNPADVAAFVAVARVAFARGRCDGDRADECPTRDRCI